MSLRARLLLTLGLTLALLWGVAAAWLLNDLQKTFVATLDQRLAQSARMVAMRAATDAAEEMVETLTLELNKARQAMITAELLDLVGGVAALEA